MVRFTRAVLPYLRKSELKRIINISSTSAAAWELQSTYTVTKAAIINLSKHLANVLVKDKILVIRSVLDQFTAILGRKNIANRF